MKERILEFLKAENKSSAQLADEIGVQPSGISHILSGRNNPSLDFVIKMLDKYRFLSTEWLLFGKGMMYRDSKMQSLFNELEFTEKEKDTEGNQNAAKKSSDPVVSPGISVNNELRISDNGEEELEKIVFFYSDGSFKEYHKK
jgi:transcriptional regulator with XRE-family HTH domain